MILYICSTFVTMETTIQQEGPTVLKLLFARCVCDFIVGVYVAVFLNERFCIGRSPAAHRMSVCHSDVSTSTAAAYVCE